MSKKNKIIINFVTGNAGKVKTMQSHIKKYGFEVIQTKLSLVEPQAPNAEAVALSKAMQAFKTLKQPVVVEDSSFHVDELKGFPGPYIKYILQTLGVEGILNLTKNLKDRTCRFTSALAYIDSDGVPRTFVQKGDAGKLDTKVDKTPSDEAWSDLWRIFIPVGFKKPLTGLSKKERDVLSKKWEKESVFSQFASWLNEKSRPVKKGDKNRMLSSDFEFPIPRERIAIRPRPHGQHKLIVYNRKTKEISHHRFEEIIDLLPKETVVVINNSKVVNAALRKSVEDGTYLHVMYPSHPSLDEVFTLCPWKPEVGETVEINGGKYVIEGAPVVNRDVRVGKLVPNDKNIKTLPEFLEKHGSLPIPIYVNSERLPDDFDHRDYQNCYAKVPGSIECPTAGLHFYSKLMDKMKKKGIEFIEVTLHIGYGTWKSFKTDYIDEHDMDAEEMIVSENTLECLREVKKQGRPILAVGTSSTRTLESLDKEINGKGDIKDGVHRDTGIFIYPGKKLKVADMLLTNFAYPRTPIMALAAAFSGLNPLKKIFTEALERDYLFYTYGDSILIL
jgi:S-adenosylmethionine:tRNA ribosyltransferase-isomerase